MLIERVYLEPLTLSKKVGHHHILEVGENTTRQRDYLLLPTPNLERAYENENPSAPTTQARGNRCTLLTDTLHNSENIP